MSQSKLYSPHNRFYFDISVPIAAISILAFGILLILVPLIVNDSIYKFALTIAIVLPILGILWLGFARGTYITVEKKNGKIYGTLFFIRAHTTDISNVVSVRDRGTFGGLMTEVYMTYRNTDGTTADRTIATKQSFKKSDFRKLLEAIRSANPHVEISPSLLRA